MNIDSWANGPFGFFFFGLFFVLLGAAGTYSGEAWARYGRVICRAEQPGPFWGLVVSYYLVGFSFIGYFLYKVYLT